MTEIGFASIVRLWLRAFGAQHPSEHPSDGMSDMIQFGVAAGDEARAVGARLTVMAGRLTNCYIVHR